MPSNAGWPKGVSGLSGRNRRIVAPMVVGPGEVADDTRPRRLCSGDAGTSPPGWVAAFLAFGRAGPLTGAAAGRRQGETGIWAKGRALSAITPCDAVPPPRRERAGSSYPNFLL